jgi:hypothetical protein
MEKSLSLTNQPVDTAEYKSYDIDHLPKLILGFDVKNKYDQERLKFKLKYRPKNILHFICRLDGDELEPLYLHGIELEMSEKINHIISLIKNAQPISLTGYKNILKYNNLSCNACFGHTADGVFPIDVDHLGTACDDYNEMGYKELREMLQPVEDDMPWFSNWSAFKIFLLLPSDIY